MAGDGGYSGTPLAKKLGLRDGARVAVFGEAPLYEALFDALPADLVFEAAPSASTDVAHGFFLRRDALAEALVRLRGTLRDDAALWVSWPKKASKALTDVTEDVVRELALPLGFVDVKVGAVSDVWSGLKLVVRRSERTR
jgi:hypothetical protein